MRWFGLVLMMGLLGACGSSGGGGTPPPNGQLTISSVTPSSGPQAGGQTVAIRGSGFSSGVVAVLFDGIAAADVEVTSDNNIDCTTPPNDGGTVEVRVTTQTNSVALPAGYTYNAEPIVFFVAPAAGFVGTTVSVVGLNFATTGAGRTSVFFGTAEAGSVSVVNTTTIFCTVPPNTDGGAVDVTVVNDNGQDTLRNAFIYLQSLLAEGRLTMPIDAGEAATVEAPAAILDADLATGAVEVYVASPRGEGRAWIQEGAFRLPFAPGEGDAKE